MKQNKKKGFTLVELLAVIVILAIILVIAVPQIMSTIKDTTKASLESSAKMVAAQVEKQYTVAQTLGKEFGDTGSCMQDWAGLNDVDYASCTYEITSNGTAKVTIKGQGKFKNLYVCSGTRSSASATEGECASNTLVSHIQELYSNESTRTSNGLTKDNTIDQNIRYAGANNAVKNYVEFGNTGELWRIIGIFEVEKVSGGTEELVKIVRDEPFKDSDGTLWMSWDSSASTINGGYGINEWRQADLKSMLNTYYIGEGTSCTYCNNSKQAICSNSCNSSVTPINSTYTSMIENVVWNTGTIEWNDDGITPLEAYNAERGNTTGKICTQGDTYCNDTVTRGTTWEGKIGLIYPSDYAYAGGSTCTNITNTDCGTNNWLPNGTDWTITPIADSGFAYFVWHVDNDDVGGVRASYDYGVRASLYLKSNVQINGGDGSKNNPYKLK